MSDRVVDIASLSPEERLRLIGELWDSLGESNQSLPLNAAQEAELDRRLDDLEAGTKEPVGIPWDEVLNQIRQRHKIRPSRK